MEQSDLYLLQNAPPYHVQAVVKARRLPYAFKGASLSNELSPEALTEIAQYLFDPAACREVIRGLSELEKVILGELAACGGRANSRDLALYLSASGLLNVTKSRRETKPLPERNIPNPAPGRTAQAAGDEAAGSAPRLRRDTPSSLSSSLKFHTQGELGTILQYPVPHPHGIFEQALHHLLLLGLVFWSRQTNFTGRDYANGVYDGVLLMPQAVMTAMNEVASEERKKTERTALALPQDTTWVKNELLAHEGLARLQRTLYLYWSLAAASREGLSLVSNRLLSRPALRQVVEQLNPAVPAEQVRAETDIPYLLFIRLLLMHLGLLYEQAGAIFAAPADAFFALPLLERVRRCYRLWLETAFWNELNYLPNVVLRPGPAPLDPAHEEVVRSRQAVMERLLQLQPGVWQDMPTFIARTKLYLPYLLFPRQYGSRAERYSTGSNPYGWDVRLRRGWLTPREGWYQVEGEFIRTIIAGPLHWLGLAEVYREDKTDMFSLAAIISLVASDTPPEVEEPAWGRLVVQPNFELVALAPVSEALLVKLDRFAERVRLEQIAHYRLTRASIMRAVQMGMHAGDVQQVLEKAAGGAIPQNVRYSLLEWERQARRIELWPRVTLLEVDDPALLDSLYAGEETRLLLGRRLAPTLAEVAADRLPDIQDLLWQREYLPAVVSAPAQENLLETGRLPSHEAQWRLLDDGLLQPCHPAPDLYLSAELERITEYDELTGWRRITPLAIQQACKANLPLEHIVRFLQNYCQGGVPPSFLIRLKLWGGGYGDQDRVQVEQAPLLRLPAQALHDIQADEELGQLLGAEVPQDSRLVRVAPEALERVIQLLQERGFTVE